MVNSWFRRMFSKGSSFMVWNATFVPTFGEQTGFKKIVRIHLILKNILSNPRKPAYSKEAKSMRTPIAFSSHNYQQRSRFISSKLFNMQCMKNNNKSCFCVLYCCVIVIFKSELCIQVRVHHLIKFHFFFIVFKNHVNTIYAIRNM